MSDRSTLHVLVLEDNDIQRAVLVAQLRSLGVGHVYEAADGAQALDVLSALGQPADLVLCDLQMEGMDGIEFLRHLAAQCGPLPIAMFTAVESDVVTSVVTMAEGYGLPVVGRLRKPSEKDDLERLLSAFEREDPQRTLVGLPRTRQWSVSTIREALERGEFVPFFQPKYVLEGRRMIGAEVLARWVHPDIGTITPDQFIGVMESNGLIDELTETMLAQSFQVLADLIRQGSKLRFSVNVSPLSLQDTSTPRTFRALVQAAGIPPPMVIFEVTETAITNNVAGVIESLTRLRMQGFGISIDDFGTGYSSMLQLGQLPFNELKIASSFVNDAPSSAKHRSILESILGLARKLSLTSVAEGIETEEQLRLLLSLGCEQGQGFLLSRPLAKHKLLKQALAVS